MSCPSPSFEIGDESTLLEGLRARDERAFSALCDAYTPALLRVAQGYVRDRSVAEEVVQDTWLGVLNGLERFEGRSSLKTWIFKILTNTAASRGARERRTVPFSSLAATAEEDEPSVDPERFLPPDHDRYPNHWWLGPVGWQTPEEGLLSGETRGVILDAIEQLPTAQRIAVTLRDIEGWSATEVAEALETTEGNQRVLLHRGRTKVRAALERYFGSVQETVQPDGSPTPV
jgi:RNA polymerase sigma-70 factor (ECF subfamily)